MDTALEALYRAMLTDGWFTATDGEADAPTGCFGYVSNTEAELPELFDAFADTIAAYGKPDAADVIGSFVATVDSNGIVRIYRHESDTAARKAYEALQNDYYSWTEH